MTEHFPITPPDELVAQWIAEIWHEGTPVQVAASDLHLAAKSSQWGYEQRAANNEDELQKARDEELEACCEWLDYNCPSIGAHHLRAARRPKPPSLKEQALEALNEADQGLNESEWRPRSNTIRRALEALPDD